MLGPEQVLAIRWLVRCLTVECRYCKSVTGTMSDCVVSLAM